MSYIGSPPGPSDPELVILSGVTSQQATYLSEISTFMGPILALSADNAKVALGVGNAVGKVSFFARTTAPVGFLKANGAAVLVASYPDLTTAIYCGDANNATALFGYRCDNADGTSRNITGIYIVLPDMRGEFPRGWDDSRGIDSGRSFGSAQSDAIRNLSGTVGTFANGGIGGNWHTSPASRSGVFTTAGAAGSMTTGGGGAGSGYSYIQMDASLQVPTAAENRPRNVALLACIKY